jgi:hypothetical protein
MQDQQIADLQEQVADQQAQAYAPPPPLPAQAAGATAGAGSDTVARLQELANLHASGVLSDDEFAVAKQKVLAGE